MSDARTLICTCEHPHIKRVNVELVGEDLYSCLICGGIVGKRRKNQGQCCPAPRSFICIQNCECNCHAMAS